MNLYISKLIKKLGILCMIILFDFIEKYIMIIV